MNMNVMRITGMVSGLDTDQMVRDLMKVEYMRVDTLKQKKQIYEWQQEIYRELNSALLGLRNEVFNMQLGSNLKAMKTSSTDSARISASASFEAVAGTYTLSVTNLAAGAEASSAESISRAITGGQLDFSSPLDLSGTNRFKVTLDGVTKTVVLDTSRTYSNIDELKTEIQDKVDAAFGGSKIAVGSVGNALTFEPAGEYKPQLALNSGDTDNALAALGLGSGSSFKISASDPLKSLADKLDYDPFNPADGDSISFRINGQLFEYDFSPGGADENKSLQGILEDINNREQANVRAYYDSVTDRVVIESKGTGIGAEVNIENLTGSLFGISGALQVDTGTVYGVNAEFTLNGVAISKPENNFTIDGINYSLKDKTIDDIVITVERDNGQIFDNIKRFVDRYNEVLDRFNTRISEKRYRDYKPLTDAQREQMGDTEIEMWEQRARSGLASGDSMLARIITNMRRSIYNTVNNPGGLLSSLSEIGITTVDYRENGKLHINEAKLMEAINNKTDDVAKLFSNDFGTGVADRLYNELSNNIRVLTDKAGSATTYGTYDGSLLGKAIYSIAEDIDDMNIKLFKKQESLYNQFTAMETALARMNSQSAWLAQQFGYMA